MTDPGAKSHITLGPSPEFFPDSTLPPWLIGSSHDGVMGILRKKKRKEKGLPFRVFKQQDGLDLNTLTPGTRLSFLADAFRSVLAGA